MGGSTKNIIQMVVCWWIILGLWSGRFFALKQTNYGIVKKTEIAVLQHLLLSAAVDDNTVDDSKSSSTAATLLLQHGIRRGI